MYGGRVGSGRARCSERNVLRKDARNKPVLHNREKAEDERQHVLPGPIPRLGFRGAVGDIWLVWAVVCCIRCMEFQVNDLKVHNEAVLWALVVLHGVIEVWKEEAPEG